MDTPLNGWHAWMEASMESSSMCELWEFLNRAYAKKTVFPEPDRIFRAFELCSLEKLKVIIVGQDPYYSDNTANGLAFSTDGVPTRTLNNIFKELKRDLGVDRDDCDLSDWAEQGVLLLNPVLTVEAGKPGSHAGIGWEQFTGSMVMRAVRQHTKPLIVVLWGNKAQNWGCKYISKKDIVLTCSHPSPLSVATGQTPFSGCSHFSTINKHLLRFGDKPIDWGGYND